MKGDLTLTEYGSKVLDRQNKNCPFELEKLKTLKLKAEHYDGLFHSPFIWKSSDN